MFERMEIAEQVYKWGTPSKTNIREHANRAIIGRKLKVWEAAFPTNPDKGRTRKCKKNHAGHLRDWLTNSKHAWVYDPGHST